MLPRFESARPFHDIFFYPEWNVAPVDSFPGKKYLDGLTLTSSSSWRAVFGSSVVARVFVVGIVTRLVENPSGVVVGSCASTVWAVLQTLFADSDVMKSRHRPLQLRPKTAWMEVDIKGCENNDYQDNFGLCLLLWYSNTILAAVFYRRRNVIRLSLFDALCIYCTTSDTPIQFSNRT